MGDPLVSPKRGKREKKEILSILREMWLKGDSPLHRIYSSWEELEANVKITSETTRSKEKRAIQPCPNCGTKQNIAQPMEGIFPYQNCKSCKHPFYVNNDLTVRKLTEEERREIPGAWFQIVEDLSKNKVAVVFRLE
jgi:phage terminase large subunit GpA-like protein